MIHRFAITVKIYIIIINKLLIHWTDTTIKVVCELRVPTLENLTNNLNSDDTFKKHNKNKYDRQPVLTSYITLL